MDCCACRQSCACDCRALARAALRAIAASSSRHGQRMARGRPRRSREERDSDATRELGAR
eukprot:6184881-Pleurochrysis_carterae.AAC.2